MAAGKIWQFPGPFELLDQSGASGRQRIPLLDAGTGTEPLLCWTDFSPTYFTVSAAIVLCQLFPLAQLCLGWKARGASLTSRWEARVSSLDGRSQQMPSIYFSVPS